MFKLSSSYLPCGDQPQAIKEILNRLEQGIEHNVLMGVTGSGKTFTMANIIANFGRPALIIAPNKTLAAQLFEEMRVLFPDNSVSYFVSYYDYYQPEAYIPSTNTYIEKDSAINDEIDKLRHIATSSLLTRKDIIIVASVSCIYGLGSPEEYAKMSLIISKGQKVKRKELLKKLSDIHYKRDDSEFIRATFRVRGDVVEVFPAYQEEQAYRIEFFDDVIERLSIFDPLTSTVFSRRDELIIYPASHYATRSDITKKAIKSIQEELRTRLVDLRSQMKLEEAKRLEERTYYDIEMMEELGYCKGVENYSRHLTGRAPGEPPPTLLEYFPKDFIIFVDESHITIPQLAGMFKGDRARKDTLVQYGFRLPSAKDNRPLCFEEFEKNINKIVYVSATPGNYEIEKVNGEVVEQIIRPTGLVDPKVELRASKDQITDLMKEIIICTKMGFKTLVTTLTKKMAEDLSAFYADKGIRVKYLHSDISTLERIDIINGLRRNEFDVLVGINLLREGLDIPEVALVAILDADKEGFLRSYRSLIQIIGRASRNVNGKVLMYADNITKSIELAINETERRRNIQEIYNVKNNIKPVTTKKNMGGMLFSIARPELDINVDEFKEPQDIEKEITRLNVVMIEHARKLEFEQAKIIRDKIAKLKILRLELG